jgi:hypothetical protein
VIFLIKGTLSFPWRTYSPKVLRIQYNNKQIHNKRAELDFAHVCLCVYIAHSSSLRGGMRNAELNTTAWPCARNRTTACPATATINQTQQDSYKRTQCSVTHSMPRLQSPTRVSQTNLPLPPWPSAQDISTATTAQLNAGWLSGTQPTTRRTDYGEYNRQDIDYSCKPDVVLV